jgi:hypothetical protein
MKTRRALRRLMDRDLPTIREADVAVVVLTRTTSGPCDVYQADLERLIGQGQFDGIPIGKIVVDEPPSTALRWDAWDLDQPLNLPVTILYQRGRQVEQLRTTRASQLIERIAILRRDDTVPAPDGSTAG